ncbi:MAG TPA: hypothetical protein H9909_14370 [Candidatus Mediterraneibacter norfolkensis]|nr:hypothetical protein [Candidatus Mediterraneibacter norfolkensis]
MIRRTEFDIRISVSNICELIDAESGKPLHEEVMAELEDMLPQAYKKIHPVAFLEFGTLDDYELKKNDGYIKDALFGICSIGKEMEEWSGKFFSQGDYLRGMLADAIADDYLFQMDDAVRKDAVAMCFERGNGIIGRAEAPRDIPMSIQKRAFEVTGAGEIGIRIKNSFMYDPVKSLCLIYLLDDDTTRYHAEHDCSLCTNSSCKRRKHVSG